MPFEKFNKLQTKAEKLKSTSEKLKFWNKIFSSDLKELKQIYIKAVTNNPLAAEYTKDEIKKIEARVEKSKPYEGGKYEGIYNTVKVGTQIQAKQPKEGYYKGYLTVVKNIPPDVSMLKPAANSKGNYDAFEYAEGVIGGRFLAFLKQQQQSIEQGVEPQTKIKPKLSLSQIALISFYERKTITRKNGDSIARKYGHHSGEKLFQLFTRYSSTANRTGQTETRKKNLNKLALLESVIPKLSARARQRATDEINILKATLESEIK